MAWNGRNESILGAKAVVGDAPPAQSKKESEDVAKSETAAARKVAPAPTKSVWNGRHQKIIGNSDKSKDTVTSVGDAPSVASSVPTTARSPSPASVISSTNDSKKGLVISSAPKGDSGGSGIKSLQPLVAVVHAAKEDETTNSTAGSSTTNSTFIADETSASSTACAAVEVKVVTTTNVSSSSDSGKKDSSKKTPFEGGNNNGSAAATNSIKSVDVNNSSNSNRPSSQGKNTPSGVGANANGNNTRRAGNNNNKGGRGNGNSNNNNVRNNSSLTRGNSAGGSSRRRAANNNNNSDKPVCHFFLQGRCTRGLACAFRHTKAPDGDVPVAAVQPLERSATPFFPKSGKNGQFKKAVAAGKPFVPNKRVFDPCKARVIQLAKEAQDLEDRSKYAPKSNAESTGKIIPDEKKSEEDVVVAELATGVVASEEPPFFSIDVECIATGYGSCVRGINDGCGNEGRTNEGVPTDQYNDRSHRYPGRIAMVDSDGEVLADIVVRPPQDGKGVVSYLTPLTGLTEEMCLGADAKSLEDAVAVVKGLLPENAVIVGQAIDHDVEWLGLVAGRDFGRAVDISEIFRQRMPGSLNFAAEVLRKRETEGGEQDSGSEDRSSDEYLGFATRYRHFSLRHVCLNLLGTDIQSGVHDPIIDARYSLTLFHKYRNSSVTKLRIVRDGLHRAPITPGFAAENTPVLDGVCVSAAGYPYKRAARRIWRWYVGRRENIQQQIES